MKTQVSGVTKPMRLFCTIAGVMAIVFLSGSCEKNIFKSVQKPYYSEDYTLSQSNSAQELSDYMTGEHYDYHLFGWDVCASLVDENNDTLAFFLAVEYIEPLWRGGAGFNSKTTEGFKWAGFENEEVELTENPWSIKLTSSTDENQYVKMELVSGLMGAAEAVYRLTGDMLDADGKSLTVDVQLTDPFGVINQGYGTTSFYPHYLTDKQREAVMELPEHSIGAYLEATSDKMTCQGDYYYAIPLMEANHFSITHDGTLMSGSAGRSWMDYFVQSFTIKSLRRTAGSKWDWIAVQLPDISTAINILNITNESGTLPYARLFNTDGGKSRNEAHNAAHSWAIDEIKVEPVAGSEWTSPNSGLTYATQYRVTLASSDWSGDLTVTMVQENQEVELPEGWEYQGLGLVEGTLRGQVVRGRCWLEVQPVGL